MHISRMVLFSLWLISFMHPNRIEADTVRHPKDARPAQATDAGHLQDILGQDKRSVTRGELTNGGKKIKYLATAGALPVETDNHKVECRLFLIGSVVVARQMALDPFIASNLITKVYDGGHMFYSHATARLNLFDDVKAFFQSHVPQ